MIGLMRDPVTREPCGVHRTFLLHDGSDRLRDEWGKMMLGMRGVVMLDDLAGGDQLMIAEGIETACALRKVGFRPVWAATCAGAIAKLPPLPGVRHLTIFGDHDEPQIRHGKEVRAGLDAAAACAWEWRRAGREVGIILPRQEGSDWADVVKQVAA
jgi:hypothetical protein